MNPSCHRMPRPLGHCCATCSRQWRDLAGAKPSCFSPRGESERDTSMAGVGGRKGRRQRTRRRKGAREERLQGPEDKSFLRFGRNTRGSWSNERLSPRAGEGLNSEFWSLAAPQRFGKK